MADTDQTETTEPAAQDRLLTPHEVAELTGLSVATVQRKAHEPDFPDAVKLFNARGAPLRWRQSDFSDWMSQLTHVAKSRAPGSQRLLTDAELATLETRAEALKRAGAAQSPAVTADNSGEGVE